MGRFCTLRSSFNYVHASDYEPDLFILLFSWTSVSDAHCKVSVHSQGDSVAFWAMVKGLKIRDSHQGLILFDIFHAFGHKDCNDTVIFLLPFFLNIWTSIYHLVKKRSFVWEDTQRRTVWKKKQQPHAIISLPQINQVGNTVGMVIWYPHSCRYSITPSHVRSSLGLIPKIAGGLSLAFAFCLLHNNDASVRPRCYLCCCHGQNVSSHPCFLSRDCVQFDPRDSAYNSLSGLILLLNRC